MHLFSGNALCFVDCLMSPDNLSVRYVKSSESETSLGNDPETSQTLHDAVENSLVPNLALGNVLTGNMRAHGYA